MVYGKKDLEINSYENGAEFILPVSFIIKRLCAIDSDKVKATLSETGTEWQSGKVQAVLNQIGKGKSPGDFPPVRLWIDRKLQFKVEDGISKLVAFRRKGFSDIRAVVFRDGW